MNTLIEIGTSTIATAVISTNVNADYLLTALIGLGISIVTVVGGELVKFLVAFLKNKTEKYSTKKGEEEK